MQRHGPARRLLHFLGIDRAVGFTLAGYFWNLASGPLLLVLIIGRLSLSERGVLFTYVNISLFQLLFELGIGTVVQQLASRERAFLAARSDGTLAGDPEAKARLAALFRIGLGWFTGVMVIGNSVLLPIGWYWINDSDGTADVDWQLGWLFTVIVSVVQGIAVSLLLFLSGCGHVAAVARTTAMKDVAMNVALALGLVSGMRLLAHPFSGAAGLAIMVAWLLLTKRRMMLDLWRTRRGDADYRWRTHVWPLQWRVSISSLCLLVIVMGLQPLTIRLKGAAVAGQVGLSMYILLVFQTMAGSWVGTKVPTFGVLAATKKWTELDHVFRGVFVRALALQAGLSVLIVLASALLYEFDGSALQRWADGWSGTNWITHALALAGGGPNAPVLPPLTLGLLALAMLGVQVISSQAQYLRAHGREPMVPVTMSLAVVVTVTLALTGRYGSVTAMIAGYAFWVVALGLGGGTYVFQKMRRRWHQPEPSLATTSLSSAPD